MKSIVQDIEKALRAEAHLSALALALTLPDICSQVEFNLAESNGKKYQEWFDKHAKSLYFNAGASNPDLPEFDGLACWKLRCGVLHSGNVGIDAAKDVDIQIFELRTSGAPLGANAVSSTLCEAGSTGNGTETVKKMQIHVEWLCFAIVQAAMVFFEEWESKRDFERHSISMV